MASDAESSSSKPRTFGDSTTPLIEYAVHQARIYQKIVEDAVESAIEASKSRLSQIRSTSSAHLHQTMDLVHDAKSEYVAYENIFFGKIKEGVRVAASKPLITCGVAAGLGFIALKKPRRFLFYKTARLFMSEEALAARADARVKALRQTIDEMKLEFEKSEKMASQAEEELIRGRRKLRQAGKQIQGVIQSAYKVERQAGGLKDILEELPRRDASRFKAQVSNLASEAKRERNALSKMISKITNYGISV